MLKTAVHGLKVGGANLTICIAAIISDEVVAVTADKMVTVNMPNIEFERRSPKITMVRPFCAAATAGDALIHTEIFQRASQPLSTATTVEEVAQALTAAYVKERERLAEDHLLRPVGLTFQYILANQQTMRPEIIMQLYQQLGTWQFDFVLLMAGIDKTGPHIYCVAPPGSLRCVDAIGYWAIGSGEQHALQTFVTSDFDKPLSPVRALLTTYEAKKRAEKATGVGTQTDLWLITKKECKQLNAKELEELHSHYKNKVAEESSWADRFEKAGLSFL
jgi:hypothetical protein